MTGQGPRRDRSEARNRVLARRSHDGSVREVWFFAGEYAEKEGDDPFQAAVTDLRLPLGWTAPGFTSLADHLGATVELAPSSSIRDDDREFEEAESEGETAVLSWRTPVSPAEITVVDEGASLLLHPRSQGSIRAYHLEGGPWSTSQPAWRVMEAAPGSRVVVPVPSSTGKELSAHLTTAMGKHAGEVLRVLAFRRSREAFARRAGNDLRRLDEEHLGLTVRPPHATTHPRAILDQWKQSVVTAFMGPRGEERPPFGVVGRAAETGGGRDLAPTASSILMRGEPLAQVGLAAVALGRFDLARRALRDPRILEEGGETSLLPLLLMAWTALWSGAPERIPDLDEWVLRARRAAAGSAESVRPVAEWIRAEVERAVEPTGLGPSPGKRDDPVGETADSFLAFSSREAWKALEEAGQEGRADHSNDDPVVAARRIGDIVFGLLGARADAFYGRLRMAPNLPKHWHRLTARRLRVGEGHLTLDYRSEGPTRTFTLRPTGGRVPLNLVLEPRLPLQRVDAVRVDGSEAEVEHFQWEGGRGVRLQLPLDRERRLDVDGEERTGDPDPEG